MELTGIRDREVHVSLEEGALRRYGLSHQDVASLIGNQALNLAGGSLDTQQGEYLVRYEARRDGAAEFAQLPVISSQEGNVIRLGDIATLTDGFADSDKEVLYDGEPAIGLDIYQVGSQTPNELSAATMAMLPELSASLPRGLTLSVEDDDSLVYQDRLELLLKNAWMGSGAGAGAAGPVPGGAPRLLGHPGHPHGLPGRDAVPAAGRRVHQHDLDVRLHHRAGHRGG